MNGKIAFEEHMAIEATLGGSKGFAGESGRWDEFADEILDLGKRRIAAMDRAGIQLAILSLNAPAVQAILDTDMAIEIARQANDCLAQAVSDQLTENFGDRVYRTLVPRNIRVAEAPSYGLPVLLYDPRSKGAMAHVALAGEMLRRHEKRQIA